MAGSIYLIVNCKNLSFGGFWLIRGCSRELDTRQRPPPGVGGIETTCVAKRTARNFGVDKLDEVNIRGGQQ